MYGKKYEKKLILEKFFKNFKLSVTFHILYKNTSRLFAMLSKNERVSIFLGIFLSMLLLFFFEYPARTRQQGSSTCRKIHIRQLNFSKIRAQIACCNEAKISNKFN